MIYVANINHTFYLPYTEMEPVHEKRHIFHTDGKEGGREESMSEKSLRQEKTRLWRNRNQTGQGPSSPGSQAGSMLKQPRA